MNSEKEDLSRFVEGERENMLKAVQKRKLHVGQPLCKRDSKPTRKKSTKPRKPSLRKKQSFAIDLSDVPPQPPILKGDPSEYLDNSRRRQVKDGSSKYTGTYYDKTAKRWKAQIMVEGAVRAIGYYDTEKEAAINYARAAFKYKPKSPHLNSIYGGLDLGSVPDQPMIRNSRAATGYEGVKKNKSKFQARIIVVKGKNAKTLGTFDTPEEAAGIYARAKYYIEHRNSVKDCGKGNKCIASNHSGAMKNGKNNTSKKKGDYPPNEEDEDPVDMSLQEPFHDGVDGVAV